MGFASSIDILTCLLILCLALVIGVFPESMYEVEGEEVYLKVRVVASLSQPSRGPSTNRPSLLSTPGR